MNWSKGIRQFHRWTSIVFTLTVIANFAAVGVGKPMQWLYYVPLPPLFLLMFSGLYMFTLPYLARGRRRKQRGSMTDKPALLSGGNPQIAKGYGDAPVQAWIAAAPGWKGEVAARLDALIARTVPGVKKAVKWNTPLYGVEEGYWFASFHAFDRYLKVAFFRGASLDPVPPVASKQNDVRYAHIHEDDAFDEALFTEWMKQASKLPGEKM